MGRIGKFLEFIRGDVFDSLKSDIGGDDIHTSQIFASVGEDSQPLATDYSVSVSTPGSGKRAIIGWIDSKNKNKSNPGAKRQYSRDSEGNVVAEFILDNDGSVTVNNDNGSIVLESGGNVVINGVTIDASGNITSPATITADTDVVGGGISLVGHIHSGSPTAPDGPVSNVGAAI